MDEALESRTREWAEEFWRVGPRPGRQPLVTLSRHLLGALDPRPMLRSALFRFVDVAPACRGALERGAHLRAFLREVEGEPVPLPLRPLRLRSVSGAMLWAYGLVSSPATAILARQFIAGRSVNQAIRVLRRMWRRGEAFALDLLGEATGSEDEAEADPPACGGTPPG